ncbi:MAG TPA: orotidine-5'-phosphate decarboxylase [Thermopetrobacter sp.]|nr:orotidine-5'-phosphate decarboxylase [Thermopetrobacter sp.]
MTQICVALDVPEAAQAAALAGRLAGRVDMLKIGLELFLGAGPAGYARIAAEGPPVFLDLKLHDIPNTVARALAALLDGLQPAPAIVNVHATGGPAMLQAAARAVGGRAKLIAVTVLTALSDDDLHRLGFDPALGAPEVVVRLAAMAKDAGLDGVVCAPSDLPAVRAACGEDFLTVVPGIRPAGADMADQKRIATPKAAADAGADILVIGRPITQAADPAAAADAIRAELGA